MRIRRLINRKLATAAALIILMLALGAFIPLHAQKKPESPQRIHANQLAGRYQLFEGEFALAGQPMIREIILIDTDTGNTWAYRTNLGPEKESGWIALKLFVRTPDAGK